MKNIKQIVLMLGVVAVSGAVLVKAGAQGTSNADAAQQAVSDMPVVLPSESDENPTIPGVVSDTMVSEEVMVSEEAVVSEEAIVSEEAASVAESGAQDAMTPTDRIMLSLRTYLPHVPFTEVSESPVPGLYEAIADGNLVYVDESGQFLIQGEIQRFIDGSSITDERLSRIHMSMIEEMDEADMLIYEPDEPSDRSITVFTDISCGYCRLLHEQIDVLLEGGVRVRYLMFPRAGLQSAGYDDLQSVWCADNPQEAMTVAKAGGVIEPKACDNPIAAHVELAQRLGLRGTPLIYSDSGEKIAGYREAEVLTELVNNSEPMTF